MSESIPVIAPDWLERARVGEAEAFAPIVEAYQGAVYNLCFRMLGDVHQAEDAAQETFLRAFRRLKAYDPQRSVRTWLLSIAAHHCIDRLRRRGILRIQPMEDLEPESPHGNPESTYVRRESEAEVRRLLAALEPLERAIVTLKYWDDSSIEEIAETVGRSPDAVRTRLYRARRRLARALEPERSNLEAGERVHESPSL